MKCVGSFDAKTHFSQLLTEVEHTRQSIAIERRGKKIALLVPYEDAIGRSQQEFKDWILGEIQEVRASQNPRGPRLRAEDLIEEGRER